MESALIQDTEPPEVVAAHELRSWSEPEIASVKFRCIHCTVELTPASFRPHNVVQPHFRTSRTLEHDACCLFIKQSPDVSGQRGQVGDDFTSEIFRPVSGFPVKLVEPTEKKVTSASGELRTSVPGLQGSDKLRSRRQYSSAHRGASSRTLRAFADAHWNMTKEERSVAPIDLPGIDADTYQFAFKRLPYNDIEHLAYARVFYADIRYTAELRRTTYTFELEFFAGEYDPDKKRHTRPWKLVIDHTSWSEIQRKDFQSEFDTAVHEAQKPKPSPRCYALAQQDRGSPELLRVSKRHLVTVLMRLSSH